MRSKGKSLKDLFAENYTAVEVPAGNRKGYKIIYCYSGPWYLWDMPKEKLLREKWLELGLSLLGICLYLLTGAQKAAVNVGGPGVILAILALCLHVLEFSALIKFICTGCRTTKMTYQEIDRILGAATGFRGVFLCGTALTALLYAVKGGMEIVALLTAAGYLSCAVIAFYIGYRYKKIPFYTEKNTSLEGKKVIEKT
mgnify:FL=1